MNRPRVVLHIGTPKSGTSALQSLMWVNRDSLRERGLLYPGAHEADHFRAVVDLFNDGYVDELDQAHDGAWSRLVDEAAAFPGTTVISHELLGDRADPEITRIMSDLAFADVHVLVTARDLARQLAASWQEDLKNRHSTTFPAWLADVRHRAPVPHAERFWRRQDLPSLVDRWVAHVGPANVHVVTVPPAGHDDDLLWRRVVTVLGIEPQGESRRGIANKSLGVVEAEMLRRLNARADYGIDWPTYATRVTWYLAGFVLPEREGRIPVAVGAADRRWAAGVASEYVARLVASGVDVVGDLADLSVDPDATDGSASPPGDDQLLDAALDALVALLVQDPRWTAMAPPP